MVTRMETDGKLPEIVLPEIVQRRRGMWAMLIALCLLGAAIAVAWRLDGREASALLGGLDEPASGTLADEETPKRRTPEEITSRVIAAMGLEKTDSDPMGLKPPSGAVRVRSYRQRLKDGMQEFASYDYVGAPDLAMDHYTRLLKDRGFSRAGRTGMPEAPLEVFSSADSQVAVRLRKHAKNLNMSELTVKVTRWERRSASPRQRGKLDEQ